MMLSEWSFLLSLQKVGSAEGRKKKFLMSEPSREMQSREANETRVGVSLDDGIGPSDSAPPLLPTETSSQDPILQFALAPFDQWERIEAKHLFETSWVLPMCYSSSFVEHEYLRFHHLRFSNHDYVAYCNILLIMLAALLLAKDRLFFWLAIVVFIALSVVVVADVCVVKLWKPQQPNCGVTGTVQSLAHEIACSAFLIIMATITGLQSYASTSTCGVGLTLREADGAEHRTICVRSVYVWPLVTLTLAMYAGRPRVIATIVAAVCAIIGKYVVRHWRQDDSTEEMWMKVIMDVVIVVIVVMCTMAMERSHRVCFENFVHAYFSKQQAIKQKDATNAYLSQLLPPALYSRLIAREHNEDNVVDVSVFVATTTDLALWLPAGASQKDISDAVQKMSWLMTAIEQQNSNVERIRVTGDQFVATSNLLVSTPDHAVRVADFASAVRPFIRESGLPVRAAIHTGAIAGTVLGTRFLRYDIFGEGIDVAFRLLESCPSGEIVVSDAAKRLLTGRSDLVVWREGITLLQGTESVAEEGSPLVVVEDTSGPFANSPCDHPPATALEPIHGIGLTDTKATSPHSASSPACRAGSCPENFVSPVQQGATEGYTLNQGVYGSSETEGGVTAFLECDGDPTAEPLSPIRQLEAELLPKKLEIQSDYFGRLSFLDAKEEAKFIRSRARIAAPYHALVGGTQVLLFLMMFSVTMVEYRHSLSDCAVALMLFSVGVFVSVIALVLSLNAENLTYRIPQEVVGALLLLAAVFGSALTRPSYIANDPGYIFIVEVAVWLVASRQVPWVRAFLHCFVFLVVPFFCAYLIRHGNPKVFVIAVLILEVILFPFVLRWHERGLRSQYRAATLIQTATQLQIEERDVLEHALACVIPTALMHLIVGAEAPIEMSGGGRSNPLLLHTDAAFQRLLSGPGIVEFVSRGGGCPGSISPQ